MHKFLKKYLQEGKIESEFHLEKLSRKLAQKVCNIYAFVDICAIGYFFKLQIYEKEMRRGTAIMESRNSIRIREYVDKYFKKYGAYPNDQANAN